MGNIKRFILIGEIDTVNNIACRRELSLRSGTVTVNVVVVDSIPTGENGFFDFRLINSLPRIFIILPKIK